MEFVVMGVAVAFNFLFLKWKLEKKRIPDFMLDLTLLVVIFVYFSSSTALLLIGTVASAIISVYLYFSPPKLNAWKQQKR